MMDLRYNVTINDAEFSRLLFKIAQQAGKGIEAVAEEGEQYARKKLSTPYPPASTPGNFPHMRTGLLRALVRKQQTADPLHWTLTAWAWYAIYLELGTTNMEARPFMRPTARYLVAQAPSLFFEAMSR